MGKSQRTLASVQLSIDDTSTESPAARLVWATWLNQPNRRGTDPYARWCGGATVKFPPIPIVPGPVKRSICRSVSQRTAGLAGSVEL